MRSLHTGGRARPNHRLVKVHRSYTVEETADLLNLHRGTIRHWLARGLATCDDRRPILILGRDLIDFLKSRATAAQRKCGPGEMFCLKCRAPRRPAGGRVSYVPHTARLGNLKATCEVCGARIFRRVTPPMIQAACGSLEVEIAVAQEDISDTESPSLNGDLNQ